MDSRGVILIVTLWVLAILILFVMGLGFRMSLEARLTDYNIKEVKLFYLVKAAVNEFKAVLKEDKTAGRDTLNEDWSNNEELFKDIPLGEGTFTISYIRKEERSEEGEGEEWEEWEEEIVFYGAVDEESRININMNINTLDSRRIFRRILLRLPGIEENEDIADAILDWRDVDDDYYESGSEITHYQDLLDRPYSCKNGPFQSKEELLLVDGMTPEIFNDIKDLITIYPEDGDGKVNLYTADAGVLKTLGLDDDVVDEIIKVRKGPDGEEGTSDDPIFVGNYIDGLIPSYLGPKEVARNAGIMGNLTDLSSNHFRLHITAKTKDEKIMQRVEVVISRSDKGSEIEFWHEY